MQLLNDPKYLAWLKGESKSLEDEKWEKWLLSNNNNQRLTGKARKMISMPFLDTEIEFTEIESEWMKFQKHYKEDIRTIDSPISQLSIHRK